jgi:hypothetical protein
LLAATTARGTNQQHRTLSVGDAAGEASMRDLLLLSFPVILVAYFLVFPDQFHALVTWAIGR